MKQKQIRCPYCGSIAILRDTELTGTCTKREVSPLTKKQKIIFRSTDQKEYHFTFDKNIRLLSGHYYRLYFRNVANLSGEEKVTPDLLAYEELSL